MKETFLSAARTALADAVEKDREVLVCGQLVKYGLGGLTSGLYSSHPKQILTFPVAENLMNSAALGLALGGKRVVVIHERMDFLAVGMDPLVNHIPVIYLRAQEARVKLSLPIVILAIVGKGHGQGPQHSKNLAPWFRSFSAGWKVIEPCSPKEVYSDLYTAIFGTEPVLYLMHRELFNSENRAKIPKALQVGFCGASQRHERAFYGRGG